MPAIPDAVRDLLATGPLAHVVTLDADGTPFVTLAWAGFEGDEIVFATFFGTDQRKLRNPMRDVPPGVVTHVTIDEIYGMGAWRD